MATVTATNTLRLRSRSKRTPLWAAGFALVIAGVATIGFLYLGGAGGSRVARSEPVGLRALRPTLPIHPNKELTVLNMSISLWRPTPWPSRAKGRFAPRCPAHGGG